MSVPFEGGCLCGAVRYRCSAEPDRVYYCHCTNCRKVSGTAFNTGVMVRRETFELLTGEPRSYDVPADSGNVVSHAFCPTCGGQLYVSSSGRPTHLSIKAGSLDDPSWLQPVGRIWSQSAQPWGLAQGDIEVFDKGFGN